MWRRSVQGLTGMDASAEVREKADYTPSSLSVHVARRVLQEAQDGVRAIQENIQ